MTAARLLSACKSGEGTLWERRTNLCFLRKKIHISVLKTSFYKILFDYFACFVQKSQQNNLYFLAFITMIVAYLRVSTSKQNLSNQQDEIRRFAQNRNLSTVG